MTVRTRFAPSPTGMLHIGGVRTALFSWLYARRHGGTFILRVEDTDRERSTAEAVTGILEGMHWLGLDQDEGPFFQTQRFDRYREVIPDAGDRSGLPLLLLQGRARRDARGAVGPQGEAALRRPLPSARGAGARRESGDPVPQSGEGMSSSTTWSMGRTFESGELDDLIIARSDGTPTYNFCVVVDDFDMSNPCHSWRRSSQQHAAADQHAAGAGRDPPLYAHVPMILGADGAKLSKRMGR